MGDIYLIIIPVVAIVVVLKVCLICCRIWLYQKRREQQMQIVRQRRVQAASATARVIAVRQVQGPGGIAQQTSYAIEQPGCPTRQMTRTIIVRPASRRPNDPNLPPSYDQAITGADRSVRVNEAEGKNPPQGSQYTAAPAPAPTPESNSSLPHMPPQQSTSNLPPAYEPIPSAPSPSVMYNDQQSLLN